MSPLTLVAVGGVASILGLSLGVLFGRYVWPVRRQAELVALASAQEDVARLKQECDSLRNRAEELSAQYASTLVDARQAGEEVARVTERVAGLTRQSDASAEHIRTLETQREQAASDAKVSGAEVARLKERESALSQQLQSQAAQLAEQQARLTIEFENIANRILKKNAAELSESSQGSLRAILDPLRTRIQEFQAQVESTYNTENREVLSLREQIRLVMETSNAIGSQADGLAKALRGDPQQLGRWGELALERILETAGLTEGREYISQGRGLGLKSETGGNQRPDIVVILPEQRTMIVDSKAPLASYERLVLTSDEVQRRAYAEQLVRDMKGHIDGLSGKRYQENETLQAHDCVLMFVPIEGALAAALAEDPELFVYAWARHVVLVGPPTLLMTMRTVASIWRYELQGQYAQDIARLAGDLCDKLSMSLGDMNCVAEKIGAAMSAHNEAMKRLSTGRGNALSIGERIRSLGVRTRKPFPAIVIDGLPIAAEVESSDDGFSPEASPGAVHDSE